MRIIVDWLCYQMGVLGLFFLIFSDKKLINEIQFSIEYYLTFLFCYYLRAFAEISHFYKDGLFIKVGLSYNMMFLVP